MPTVANGNGLDALIRGAAGSAPDKSLNKYTRSNAGTPVGALTPAFNGEVVLDTTNRILWRAVGSANTDWHPVTENIQ